MPKAEQRRILATDEVIGFLLDQSNISAKNIKRLEALVTIDDKDFQTLRRLVLDIARVKPHKRRRWGYLRKHHPDLCDRAADAGLIREFIQDVVDLGAENPNAMALDLTMLPDSEIPF